VNIANIALIEVDFLINQDVVQYLRKIVVQVEDLIVFIVIQDNYKKNCNETASATMVIDMNSILCEDITDTGNNAWLAGHLKSGDRRFMTTSRWISTWSQGLDKVYSVSSRMDRRVEISSAST